MEESSNPLGPSAGLSSAMAAAPRTFPFSFTGSTGEYFRIWIVNMLLTLVTFGFYTPWARVRTRRYFHANTHLDGHSFDYLAKPINILWGYLIILAFLGLYQLGALYNPVFLLVFFAIYLVAGPWVMYKAIRFKAHNTSYRNIRFRFNGSLGDAYVIYLGMALLIPLTFGLIIPYWVMKQKEYFFRNLSFGGRTFDFTPQAGEYYTRYIIAGVIGFGFSIVTGFLMTGLMVAWGATGADVDTANPPLSMFVLMYLSYIPTVILIVFVQVFVYVSIFNYNLERLLVQQTGFNSELKVGRYYWITITNIFATIFSLGLLAPWAAIRKTQYMAESVSLSHPGEGLGEFVAESEREQSAVGDAAAEAFDIDIGW